MGATWAVQQAWKSSREERVQSTDKARSAGPVGPVNASQLGLRGGIDKSYPHSPVPQ
jgi:hypothetical protein